MVMMPRDRKAGRRSELNSRSDQYWKTEVAPVKVLQKATREPWGLAEIEQKIKEMQAGWKETYEHKRGYATLCKQRNRILSSRWTERK